MCVKSQPIQPTHLHPNRVQVSANVRFMSCVLFSNGRKREWSGGGYAKCQGVVWARTRAVCLCVCVCVLLVTQLADRCNVQVATLNLLQMFMLTLTFLHHPTPSRYLFLSLSLSLSLNQWCNYSPVKLTEKINSETNLQVIWLLWYIIAKNNKFYIIPKWLFFFNSP